MQQTISSVYKSCDLVVCVCATNANGYRHIPMLSSIFFVSISNGFLYFRFLFFFFLLSLVSCEMKFFLQTHYAYKSHENSDVNSPRKQIHTHSSQKKSERNKNKNRERAMEQERGRHYFRPLCRPLFCVRVWIFISFNNNQIAAHFERFSNPLPSTQRLPDSFPFYFLLLYFVLKTKTIWFLPIILLIVTAAAVGAAVVVVFAFFSFIRQVFYAVSNSSHSTAQRRKNEVIHTNRLHTHTQSESQRRPIQQHCVHSLLRIWM